MKIIKNIFLSFVLLCLLNQSIIYADDSIEDQSNITINVAGLKEHPLWMHRVVYTAMKRLGYDVMLEDLSMNLSIYSTDNGTSQILLAQAETFASNYPNLVMVPSQFSSVEMIVFSKEEFSGSINNWEDLADYRVSFNASSAYVIEHIPSTIKEAVKKNDYKQVFEALVNDEADIAILPFVELQKTNQPNGIITHSIIETLPIYTFVNKQYEYLVPLLTEEYEKMKADGTFEAIKSNNYKNPSKTKTVLHISSYNSDLAWERDLVNSISKSLTQNEEEIFYYNYPLNLKHSSNESLQFKLMNEQIRASFTEYSPDLIIVSNNDALEFIKEYHDSLFNTTPILFCGITNYTPELISGIEDYTTGVTQQISARLMADEILSIYPDTKNIYIVNDYTSTGLNWKKEIMTQLEDYDEIVNIIYNDNLPLSEIILDIQSKGSHTVILQGTYYRDCNRNYYSDLDTASLLDMANDRPAFSLLSVGIGSGILGGNIVDAKKQGTKVGELALKFLAGESISDIPIEYDNGSLNTWIYDYNISSKYGLNTDKLHPDHQSLNKQLTIRESNPQAYIAILASFALGAILIISLSYFVIRIRKTAKSKEFMALHDSLTGLSSRYALFEKIDDITNSNDFGGLMIIDIDDFKNVNDIYGHTFGDQCLIEMANKIKKSNIEYEIAVRMGGDEFVIVIKGNKQKIEKAIKKIENAIQTPFNIEGKSLTLTTSIGIVMFPKYGNTLDELLKNADLALYEAKKLGKERSCFYDISMSKKVIRQEQVLQILRNLNESEEAYLVYQPIVDNKHNQILGFESLLRINNDILGPIYPDEFIPIAESSRLIIPIGYWILEQACLFACKLIEENKKFNYVSVNVSAIQLEEEFFVDRVFEILKKTGLSPHYLQLEITESVFIAHDDSNIEILQVLYDSGINIALDDFGTGYSSMKYLVQLPINKLKIDKTFIDHITEDEKSRNITKMIIDMAHVLKLDVIAEGVEIFEQQVLLQEMNCDATQGYLFSKPVPENELKILIDQNEE